MKLHATAMLLQLVVAALILVCPMGTADAQAPTDSPTSCEQQTTGVVVTTDGDIPWPEDALEIFAWHGDKVEFEIFQKWKPGKVTWIGFEYDFCEVGYVCDTSVDFGTSRGRTFDGNCDDDGFFEIIVYVHEASWSLDVYPEGPFDPPSSTYLYNCFAYVLCHLFVVAHIKGFFA